MSILDELRELVIEHLGLDRGVKITLESSFTKDLGADSLDLVELILALEERYKIEILDEDTQKIVTVQDALDYLEKRGIKCH
jgi:acyl carrier protein